MWQKAFDFLVQVFPDVPEDERGSFLMNCTCFPFGDAEKVIEQLQELREQTENYIDCYGIVDRYMDRVFAINAVYILTTPPSLKTHGWHWYEWMIGYVMPILPHDRPKSPYPKK